MYKNVDLGDRDPLTQEPRAMVLEDREYLSKTASPIDDFAANIEPEDGTTTLHLIAVGAYEYYGANRNTDAFAERHHTGDSSALLPSCAVSNEYSGLVEPLQFGGSAPNVQPLPVYETFQQANVFKHHRNRDPRRSVGDILYIHYNEDMHRIELVVRLNNDKCPDFINKLMAGKLLAFSMGCHVKYDVCSVCGNRAPRRADYCEHAKLMRMPGHQFTPDGQQICVFNPNARFFDISLVYRPADRIGYMLRKVAYVHRPGFEGAVPGHIIEALNAKRASVQKLSEINKRIALSLQGIKVPGSDYVEFSKVLNQLKKPNLPAEKVTKLSSFIAAAEATNCPVTAGEVGAVAAKAMLPELDIHKTAALLTKERETIQEVLEQRPEFMYRLVKSGAFVGDPEPELTEHLTRVAEERAFSEDGLVKLSFIGMQKNPFGLEDVIPGKRAPGNLSMYEVAQDGDVFTSNRSALNEANGLRMMRRTAKALGTGALTGAAYRGVTGTGGPGAFMAGVAGSVAHDNAPAIVNAYNNYRNKGNIAEVDTDDGDALIYEPVGKTARVAHVDYLRSGTSKRTRFEVDESDSFDAVAEKLGFWLLSRRKLST